jgi:hypothetical protein
MMQSPYCVNISFTFIAVSFLLWMIILTTPILRDFSSMPLSSRIVGGAVGATSELKPHGLSLSRLKPLLPPPFLQQETQKKAFTRFGRVKALYESFFYPQGQSL